MLEKVIQREREQGLFFLTPRQSPSVMAALKTDRRAGLQGEVGWQSFASTELHLMWRAILPDLFRTSMARRNSHLLIALLQFLNLRLLRENRFLPCPPDPLQIVNINWPVPCLSCCALLLHPPLPLGKSHTTQGELTAFRAALSRKITVELSPLGEDNRSTFS